MEPPIDLFQSSFSDLKLSEANESYQEANEISSEEKTSLKHLKAIAQMNLTYIVAEDNEGGFYLVDQHAAAERTNYEKYKKIFAQKNFIVEPLIPIILEYKPSEIMLFSKEKYETLQSIGVHLEPFGGNTLKVMQVPLWARQFDEKKYVEEMVEEVLHGDRLDPIKFQEHSIATMSCKRSIKANERLDINQMQYVLDALLQCQNPYTCPHGRPTIVHFTRYQLEKLFNRTGF
jgi:DNA mismatch repair protein MutL